MVGKSCKVVKKHQYTVSRKNLPIRCLPEFLPHFRYKEAMRLGFRGVETGNPYRVTAEEIEKTLSGGAQQVLINTPTGNISQGELGFASLPGKEETFLVGKFSGSSKLMESPQMRVPI